MKKGFKSALVIGLALLMVLSSLVIVSAEELTPADDEVVISASAGGGTASPMAYHLVWKYRNYYGRMQKRRWNLTLAEWYDPAWIDVN